MQASQQLNKPKFFWRASSRQRAAAALVFLAVIGFFVFFRLTSYYKIKLWPYGCGFKQKYGLPCPGCGMTTSALKFVRGNIFGRNGAFYTQPAGALFCCILVIIALMAFLTVVFGVYLRFLQRFFIEVKIKYIIFSVIIIIVSGWAVTLARALAGQSQG